VESEIKCIWKYSDILLFLADILYYKARYQFLSTTSIKNIILEQKVGIFKRFI
jgi:hypothetical protein